VWGILSNGIWKGQPWGNVIKEGRRWTRLRAADRRHLWLALAPLASQLRRALLASAAAGKMVGSRIGEFLVLAAFSGTHACVEFRNIQHTGGKREALGNPSGKTESRKSYVRYMVMPIKLAT